MPQDFRKSAFVAALLALAVGGDALSQPAAKAKPPNRQASASWSNDDREFANKAAAGGLGEVELGRLAQQISKSAEVKKFAERIVADHAKGNEELKALASAKGITLPVSPSRLMHMKMEKMVKETGPRFDQEYLEFMVEDHRKDIKEFEKQAKSGKDPDLTRWAGDKLPALQEHLKLAEAALASTSKKGAKKK